MHVVVVVVVVVNVWFENAPQSVQIERQSTTSEVPNSVYHTQKQFLLILAFAITIHKSQGLSMKTAIVDAGPNCFRIGMVYTALSRVTSLGTLHLANRTALAEDKQLRMLYVPQL